MIRKAILCLAIALGSLFFNMSAMFGQVNTGTLAGSIVDPSGAVIPGARVKAKNIHTGLTRATISTASGQFSLSFLPPGSYSLSASAKGFQSEIRTGLSISAGQILTLDMDLKIGQMTQTVTVSGAPPLLNYSSQEQRTTLSDETIHELPTPKEDWTSLLSSTISGVQSSSTADNNSIVMNGLPPAAMSLTVDGMNGQPDPETPSFGFEGGFNTINVINTSSIAEVTVTKGVAPASAGSGMAGNVNIITKGGTNQFHGSMYEFNRNRDYDARNQFTTTRPPSNFNQFGSSLGGPIIKNRLFFFGSYEGVRNPTFALEADDMPTPEFIQSTLLLAPEYAPVFAVFPPPNQPCETGSITCRREVAASEITNDNNASGRLDYNINSANQITLRVIRSRPSQLNPSILPSNPRTYTGKSQLYSAQYTYSRSNWTAATRYGFNWLREARLDHGYDLGTPEVHFSGFNSQGGENFNILGHTGTLQEDVSLARGRHTIEFGGIAQLNTDGRIDDTTTYYKYGNMDDFLANIPSKIEINFPLTQFQLHRWQIGGYLQDTFRITPSLTLDAGLRYDYWTVPKERDGRLFTRDPSALGPGTGDLRRPSSAYKSYWPNFGPRVGISWSLGSRRNTVIRSGFGMFYGIGAISGGVIDDVLDNPFLPFRLTLDREQALAMGLKYPLDRDAVATELSATQSPVATTAISNDFPNPRSFQYTFDIQHEFGDGFVLDSGYNGNIGNHLYLVEEVNLPDRITGVTPAPAFGQFRYYQSTNQSNYDSWQTSLMRHFANGLQLGVHYTFARSYAYDDHANIDWSSDISTQDNSDYKADYGPTDMDITSFVSANFVYLLPFDQWAHLTGHVAKEILGGWQLSGIVTASTGSPGNVGDGDSSYPADRPDRAPGVSPYLHDYHKTLQYLNPAAFVQVPLSDLSGAQIRPGNEQRNWVRDPGMWNIDLGLAKNFSITSHSSFQLRMDAFNALNHTNLSGLDTDITSSSFGTLSDAVARTVQIGGRLTF